MKHLLLTIAAVVLVGCGPSVDIWTAAYNGQIEIVKTHLNNGIDVNVNHPELKHSPLWFACDGGHLSTSSLLIKKGADINGALPKGYRTPLGIAARNKNLNIVKLLINNGASINQDELSLAIVGGNKDVADIIINRGIGLNISNGLFEAVYRGKLEIVRLLIEDRADINIKSVNNNDFGDSNRTPLHFAAAGDYKQISEVLITNGAIVNATDAEGETPLDLAIFKRNNETATLLRKHGGKTSEELKAEEK